MTVKELMDFLKDAKPDMTVVLSSDAEGNDYHVLGMAQEATYVPDKWGHVSSTWNLGEDMPNDVKPCVVLWPE